MGEENTAGERDAGGAGPIGQWLVCSFVEGMLTQYRFAVVSNMSLSQATRAVRIPPFLSDGLSCARVLHLWYPLCYAIYLSRVSHCVQVGMAEAAEMEREIHRMRLRADALQRTQEKLIKDMELAIDKREMISIKVKAKTAGVGAPTAAGPPATLVRVCLCLYVLVV